MLSVETQLAQLEGKVNSTAEDVSEIKVALRDIAASLQTLALLEQKHSETRDALARSNKRIDNLENWLEDEVKGHEKRIQALEIHDAKGLWVERVIWVVMAGVFAAVTKGLV